RALRGTSPDIVPAPGKKEMARLDSLPDRNSEPDGANGLRVSAAARPGDARDGHRRIHRKPGPGAGRHRSRDGLTYGALCRENRGGYSEERGLEVVVIAHHGAHEHIRAARHFGQTTPHQATGARLGGAQPEP